MLKPEIERKFLVKGDFQSHVVSQLEIVQGYLSLEPERTVRIRISGQKAFLTIKGKSNDKGTKRVEFEIEIDPKEAAQLVNLCVPHLVEKTRHIIPIENGLFFEVDVFKGENEGLIVAEIELPRENTPFKKPDWLGDEVTGDVKYYNVSLVKNPYKLW